MPSNVVWGRQPKTKPTWHGGWKMRIIMHSLIGECNTFR